MFKQQFFSEKRLQCLDKLEDVNYFVFDYISNTLTIHRNNDNGLSEFVGIKRGDNKPEMLMDRYASMDIYTVLVEDLNSTYLVNVLNLEKLDYDKRTANFLFKNRDILTCHSK